MPVIRCEVPAFVLLWARREWRTRYRTTFAISGFSGIQLPIRIASRAIWQLTTDTWSLTCYRAAMVRTYGLTHVALAVADPERSFRFYERVFGAVLVYHSESMIQAQTPGSRDVLVFEKSAGKVGRQGGIIHFGFRLTDPEDIGVAVDAVRSAGGTIIDQGDFCPGEPYVFFKDLDGYVVEIWYEIPTPIDPPSSL